MTVTKRYEANTDENLSMQRAGCVRTDAGHTCPVLSANNAINISGHPWIDSDLQRHRPDGVVLDLSTKLSHA